MELYEIEGDGVDWMDLTQETEKWLVGGGSPCERGNEN